MDFSEVNEEKPVKGKNYKHNSFSIACSIEWRARKTF